MESFNKQDTIKKSFEKQATISASSSLTTTSPHLYQDTNYIGITINDDIPKYNHSSPTAIPTSTSTSNTLKYDQSPLEPYYKSPHHTKRFHPPVIMEEEPMHYRLQPERSGAFLKIKTQADLPMSHHRRAREGKRYGVKCCKK